MAQAPGAGGGRFVPIEFAASGFMMLWPPARGGRAFGGAGGQTGPSLADILAGVPLPTPPDSAVGAHDAVGTLASGSEGFEYDTETSSPGSAETGGSPAAGHAFPSSGTMSAGMSSMDTTAAASQSSGTARGCAPTSSNKGSDATSQPDPECAGEDVTDPPQQIPDAPRPRWSATPTTLTIRNIPALYTPQMLMAEWPNHGSYDFLYLPFSTATQRNLTYAFVNFTSPAKAEAFMARWQKARLANFSSHKPLNICYAVVQGLEANLVLLRKKRVGRVRVGQGPAAGGQAPFADGAAWWCTEPHAPSEPSRSLTGGDPAFRFQ